LEFAPEASVEAITMVGGYSFQALGIGFMCALMHKGHGFTGRLPFITAIAMHFAVAAAAMLANTYESLVTLGFAMNFLYGIVCAFYLHRLSQWVPRKHRGVAFGSGYACSVITTWALSMLQGGSPLGPTESIIVCAALSLLAIAMIAGGLAGLVYGGRLFVNSATEIAKGFGVSDKFIAITVMAAGTSMPELATCVVAALKGRGQLALGNILGSNISNILLILGLSSLITPLSFNGITSVDMITLLGCSIFIFLSAYMFKKRRLDRIEACILLLIEAGYMWYLIANL
jgi:hypothetical protein